MYLLDTNVISGLANNDAVVLAWLLQKPSPDMYTTVVCEAEVLAGLAVMPVGRRRTQLTNRAQKMFQELFFDRVLAFDRAAAAAYGDVFGHRQRSGRPTNQPLDLMIAAIGSVHGATIVTRNTGDFEACGVETVNPWSA